MGTFRVIDPKLKSEVIDQVRNNGMSVSQAANKYEVNPRTIYGWLKSGIVDNDRNLILELNKLKRENEQLYKLLGRATAELNRPKY
jgi:transposase-like protein